MSYQLINRPSLSISACITAALVTAPQLFAQGAAPAARSSLLDRWVIDGGPTMLFIGGAAVAFVALSVYNFMNLTKAKFVPTELFAVLHDHMTACRVRSAIEVAASNPSVLGRMVAYAFPNIDATQSETLGRDKIEDAIAEFINNETRKNMTWINYISVVAQASPMLGLLGTVMGMVGAFATLKTAGAADPSQLAGDISVALLTTLWGLIVALPCIVLYYFFKNKYNDLVAQTVHAAEELINSSIATVNADTLFAKIPEGIDA